MKKIYEVLRIVFVAFLMMSFSSLIAQRDSLCVADFSYEVSSIIGKPSVIQFQNHSTGNPTAYKWTFGDGTTSLQSDPLHYFPESGTFSVVLEASNEYTHDQISKEIIIDVPLQISFSFKLDSNHIIPNTFLFTSEIEGYYDHLFWDFGERIITNVTDTSYSYTQEDFDYQVCLTAKYYFNDTSVLQKVSCQGLTTAEYFDIGGQVLFGDSLMNNPYPTGDTGVAYLYRMDKGNAIPIDTNYFVDLGYYWFANKLKSYYIIKTSFTNNSTHHDNFAPTYIGNTTLWEQAEIINLAQDKYREDISMVEKMDSKSGHSQISGSVLDILDTPDIKTVTLVYLFNTEEELIDYQYTENDGHYSFKNISSGHYLISADITGISMRPQLIYIDGKGESTFKSSIIESEYSLFPNPAHDYSILQYHNYTDKKVLIISYLNSNGLLIKEELVQVNSGRNYIRLDLSDLSNGLIFIKLVDEQSQLLKLLHY